jgi:glycine/D-amino acid oxidase-like deaminating enzyme
VDSYQAGVSALGNISKIVKKIGASCEFKEKNSIYLAASEKDAEWLWAEFLCRKKFNFAVSWLSENQLKQNYGICGHGAILSEVGASLDGYNLTHALINFSVKNYGLNVFDHTGVESVEYHASENFVLTDNQRIIKARYIVYATGYETQQIMKSEIVDLNSTYAFVSEPLERIPNQLKKCILWDTQNPYLYMRTTSDDRILVGGGDEKFENAKRRDKLIEEKENYLLESIQKVIPDLKLIPDFAWAGTFGATKDSLPYIGSHPDYPNSFFILGFGGNGITFSIIGMQILSDAISGKRNKFLEYYRFNR